MIKKFENYMSDEYVMPDHQMDIIDDLEEFYDLAMAQKLRKNSKEYKRYVRKINDMMTVVNNKLKRQMYKLIELE